MNIVVKTAERYLSALEQCMCWEWEAAAFDEEGQVGQAAQSVLASTRAATLLLGRMLAVLVLEAEKETKRGVA